MHLQVPYYSLLWNHELIEYARNISLGNHHTGMYSKLSIVEIPVLHVVNFELSKLIANYILVSTSFLVKHGNTRNILYTVESTPIWNRTELATPTESNGEVHYVNTSSFFVYWLFQHMVKLSTSLTEPFSCQDHQLHESYLLQKYWKQE